MTPKLSSDPPIISYSDLTNDRLKVAACDNATCTSATITPLATSDGHTSIAIGINGKPVIASAEIVACGNPTCRNY